MRNVLVVSGGVGVVALTGVLAHYDPNYLALLWPLVAAAGGGVYVARHPEVLPDRMRALLGAPARLLTDQYGAAAGEQQAAAAVLSVAAALTEPAAIPLVMPEPSAVQFSAPAQQPQSVDLLSSMLAAPLETRRAPIITPPPELERAPRPPLPGLHYLPDMDRAWLAQYFPAVAPALLAPISTRPLVNVANGVLRVLLIDGLTVQRAMMGTSEATAQLADAWSVLLVIVDRAPSEIAGTKIRERIAHLHTQSYASGGTAVLAVLAQPQADTPTNALAEVVAALADAATQVPTATEDLAGDSTESQLEPAAAARSEALFIEEPETSAMLDDAAEPETSAVLDDAAEPASSAVFVEAMEGHEQLLARRPRTEPAIDQFFDAQRASATAMTAAGKIVGPSEAALNCFVHAAPIWRPGERLPIVHFGVSASGNLVSGPLELTCIFAPSQRGKTSLVIFLMSQLLQAIHPQTGRSLVPWFMTTKYEERNTFGVSIGRLLRQAYNIRKLPAPRGIEPDGSGSYRVLLMLEAELRRRLNRAMVDPDVQHDVMALIVDEWTNTARQLKRMRVASDEEDAEPTVVAGLGDGSRLVEDAGDDPLAHAVGAVDSLVRQGLGMLMPLILVTQDGLVKNTGLDTGLMASFSTYIGHTELDAGTLRIIAKGDQGKLAQINRLKQRHTGWFYAREGEIIPFWFPWVTNDLIDLWLRDLEILEAPTQPIALLEGTASTEIVVPEVSSQPQPEDWPETVRNLVAGLGDRLPVIVDAFGKLGLQVPLSPSGVQRRAMLGIPQPKDPAHAAVFDRRLVLYLAKLRKHDIKSNTLAAVLFGRTGQAAQDITNAIERHAR